MKATMKIITSATLATLTLAIVGAISPTVIFAAEPAAPAGGTSNADLAKQLSNPIAALISLPFQLNYDDNIGPIEGGDRTTLNVQPVIPMSLNDDWNVISRTILPLVNQRNIYPGSGTQTGFGDIVQSVFFSPVKPTDSGWIWGAGPVLLIPTATDDLLGGEQFGVGPTAVALRQQGPWTYGALANHIWSVAGNDDRSDINATFAQPFISYTWPSAWTASFNAEGTYNWESDELNLPLSLIVSKVTKIGGQLVSIAAGPRYYVASTDNGPEGVAARLICTFLFPR